MSQEQTKAGAGASPAVSERSVIEANQAVARSIVEAMPKKAGKNRAKHILVKDGSVGAQKIEADVRTIPGIMTSRGCAYAGCKGVVFGPIKDMVHITHGPVGCSYYTWGTRRNFAKAGEDGKVFTRLAFTTDMQESDIVFGGEKRLAAAIREAYELFKPEAIGVYATCPVGLIGDDIEAVARDAEKELGIKVIAVSCEGYRGVSQSAGHHLASNALMEHVVGTEELPEPGPYDVNLFGEYNIGGDAWEVKSLLERIGYRVVATLTGDASIHELAQAHRAKLSLLQCHRSINYTNRMMVEKYGVPWLKVNFLGVEAVVKSLRDMAIFFEDEALSARTEEVIAEELSSIDGELGRLRARLSGKRAAVYVGGSRAHHWQDLFESLGMETVLQGYQFAHRDDYEGSEALSDIKPDATRRVVMDLSYEKEEGFDSPYDEEAIARKREQLPELMHYEGMNRHAKDGSFIVDDLNHYETEVLVGHLKPDIFCTGIKDKFVIHKMGVPSRQAHSYDYSGPYAGFQGILNFARDIDIDVNSPTWKLITPPWAREGVA